MEIARNGFWEHWQHWRQLAAEGRKVRWEAERLENDWCADCKLCCGPQGDDELFPMALLPDQVGPDTAQKFYLLNESTAELGKKGCKSHSDRGCKLPIGERPVACGLFPLVLANGRMYLYLMCPAVLNGRLADFLDLARKAAEKLARLPLAELRHISIDLDLETLARKYVDMHIQVFDAAGCKIILD